MLEMRSGVELRERYVVHTELGAGGYAAVWKASDKQLNRQVALKQLFKRGLLSSEADLDALLDEARKSAQLLHPNIVQVYDVIEHEGERFIVMEYVDGQSLATYLKDRALTGEVPPLDIAIAITRETLLGLAFAHDRSICHRDLSPANILLTSGGTPKIADFGIAKVLDTTTSVAAPNNTQGGTGNAHYMSPEQARGEPADFASDLFMVGILSYLLLTVRHPFAHPSGLFDISELLLREDYVAEVPKAPVGMVATQQRIFREFAAVVMRLLQRERAGRFGSAREALDAVDSITPAVDCPQCGERNAEHHRFCAFCGHGLRSSEPESSVGADDNAGRADEVVNRGFQLSQQRNWDAAIELYRRAIEVDPGNSRAFRNLAFALNRAGRYDDALRIAHEALGLAGLQPEHRASILYELAVSGQNLRRLDEAYAAIQEAITLQPRSPKLIFFRARLQEYRGNFDKAKTDAQRVLRLVPDHAGALRLLDGYVPAPRTRGGYHPGRRFHLEPDVSTSRVIDHGDDVRARRALANRTFESVHKFDNMNGDEGFVYSKSPNGPTAEEWQLVSDYLALYRQTHDSDSSE